MTEQEYKALTKALRATQSIVRVRELIHPLIVHIADVSAENQRLKLLLHSHSSSSVLK